MTDELKELLDSYHTSTLLAMAEVAGMDVSHGGKKLRKSQLLSNMRREFFTQARIETSMEELSRTERAILDRILLHGEQINTKHLRRELVRTGLAQEPPPSRGGRSRYQQVPYATGYVGMPGRTNPTIFEDLIANLTYHGLVFSKDPTGGPGGSIYRMQFHPASILFVPPAVRRWLPEPQPIPLGIPDLKPQQVIEGDPWLLLRDLYLYWDAVRRNGAPLIKSGLVGKRALKSINEALLVPDLKLENVKREDETGRLFLLRQLLENLKLVRRQDGKLVTAGKNPLQVPKFWSWTPTEQLSACLEAWTHVDGTGGLEEADQYYPRYSRARSVILAVVQELETGIWLDPDEMVERVQAQDPNFLFADHTRVENSRGNWYYGYGKGSYYGSTRSILRSFERHEAQFVRYCLSGFLCQLGVVEVGYDGEQMVGIRRVHEPAISDPADAGKLIIQPNFHIMAMGPVSATVLAQLDLFAERQQADRGVFEYHLSRESVYQAQQMGMEPAEVIRFLSTMSDTELPQNVRRSLEEWVVHSERIVFRSGVSLLQAVSPELLAKLVDGPHVGKHLSRPVSQEVVMIENQRQAALISALVSQGLFPAVSGANPEAADRSVLVQSNGAIHPVHAVPSLHLRGRLARLAEETDEGNWRLTPGSVRQAGGSKNRVLRALDELGKLHCGELPAELVKKVKAWGGYYGDASVETLTLIRFRDRAALDELCQHPDLQDKLVPFPTGSQTATFASVRPEDLAKVREILAEYGVEVGQGL